ncbi:MAG: hypothetical protein ACRC46_00850 [Thermoguttaceae bacterium]
MSHWLTIAWQRDGLRLLVASGVKRRLVWERAISFPAESFDAAIPAFRDEFAAFVASEHLTKYETTIVLPRSLAEVRSFTVPRVPFEELPDLVRFQATREFTAYDPAAPLDFFVIDPPAGTETTTHRILAAMLRPAMLASLQQLCQTAQLKLSRVVLQPCELAAFWKTTPNGSTSGGTLLVEIDGDEVTQTCVAGGQSISMRSHRLNTSEKDDAAAQAAQLATEIKRTSTSAQNELLITTERVVVIGNTASEYESRLASLLPCPVSSLDLASVVKSPRDGSAWPTCGAAMIGATQQTVQESQPLLDFLNPKRPPAPASKRHAITFAVAVVLAVIVGLFVWGFVRKTSLESHLVKLKNEAAAISRSKPERTKNQQQVALLDAWMANDVAWFDELEWLSRRLPDSASVVLSSMVMRSNKGVATLTIPAMAQSADIVSLLEDLLTDAKHRVEIGNLTDNPSENSRRYAIRFQMVVAPAVPVTGPKTTPHSDSSTSEPEPIPDPEPPLPEPLPAEPSSSKPPTPE